MKIEKQVCAHSYALRFQELGVPQKSLFYYHPIKHLIVYSPNCPPVKIIQVKKESANENVIYKKGDYKDIVYPSAYTVAELGEMLPPCNPSSRSKDGTGWYMGINFNIPLDDWNKLVPRETEANVRAEILIYLIKKGYVKVEDINNG